MTETQGALLADRYRLVEQLGRGGMGVVWRAHDEVFNREVAVKEVLLPAELPRDERESVIGRTLREARVAAKLSHPNVVKVYDVVRAGGRPWIVMELVQAQSLTELIELHGPLPPAEVARIGLQVLAALGAAHGAGINHRDVKPGNVLCTEGGRVVLTDFGIASLEGDSTATSTGPLMGSPSYIAPERVRGRPASPASDLWSLAATLYAAVEGRPPYDRDGIVETVTAVVNEEPDPFQLAGPLATVLHRMFKKDPAERPTAAQTRIMLREVAGASNRRDIDPDDPPAGSALQPVSRFASGGPVGPAAETAYLPTAQSSQQPPMYDASPQTEVLSAGTPAWDHLPTGGDLRSLREPVHPVVAALAVGDESEAPKRGVRRTQVALAGLAVVALLGGGAAALHAVTGEETGSATEVASEQATASPSPSLTPVPSAEAALPPAELSPEPSPTASASSAPNVIPVRPSPIRPAPRPSAPAPRPSTEPPPPPPPVPPQPQPSPPTEPPPPPPEPTEPPEPSPSAGPPPPIAESPPVDPPPPT